MKISVIVPAYNSENFISETLDCLLSQSLRDIQIVVVDDGSTDGTGKIIKDYAEKHPCILPVYQENAGVSAARNKGIDCAEGEYILFLDSDDLLSENALSELCSALDETQADIALCRVERFGWGKPEVNPVADSIAKDKEIDCYDKRLINNFLVSNKCYRTDFLKKTKVRFPLKRYTEDGAFYMQNLYHFPKITGVYGATMYYRKHTPKEGFSVTQSVSVPLLSDCSDSFEIIYNAAKASFKKEGCTCKDAEGYLQEILLKAYSMLTHSFYRIIWQSDDESLKLMYEKHRLLCSMMTASTLASGLSLHKDIGKLVFSKSEIAESPLISVVAKNPDDAFINSVYAQSMPLFEFICTCNAPEKENAVVIPEKNFRKNAVKSAKGKIVLNFKGNEQLDSRLFKVIALLKNSSKTGFLPDFLIVLGAKILLKIKK